MKTTIRDLFRSRPALMWLCVIVTAATIASAPMLLFGISYGHSHGYNLSWQHGFTEQLQAGVWYPRWLSNLNNGAGSPVFFFYAPLPFYLSGIFGQMLCPGCTTTTHVAIGEWLLLVGSGVAFYAYARRYGPRWAAAVGALVYMLAPYHFEIDLWQRQAIGEFAAYVWMPLILLSLERTVADSRFLPALVLSYAGLAFSHLPSTVLFSVYLPVHTLVFCIRTRSPSPALYLAAAVVLASGLSAVYLIPALYAQDYASMYLLWTHYFDYRNWFFFDGKPEPDAYIGNRIFLILMCTTAMIGLLSVVVCRARRKLSLPSTSVPWIAGLLLVLFMVSPLSKPVWELVTVLKKVGFPWRIVIVADLALAMMLVITLQFAAHHWREDRITRIAMIAVAGILTFLELSGARAERRNLERFYPPALVAVFHSWLDSGLDTNEYIPAWVGLSRDEFMEAAQPLPRAALTDRTAGMVDILGWEPRHIRVHVDVMAGAEMVAKQFYFPGWEAINESNGQKLPLSPTPRTGLLAVRLPRGHYNIRLTLAPLWEESVGTTVSELTLLLLLIQAAVTALAPLRGTEPRTATASGDGKSTLAPGG